MSINGIALTTGQIQRAHKIDLAFQSIIPLCQIVVYIYKTFYEFLRFHQDKMSNTIYTKTQILLLSYHIITRKLLNLISFKMAVLEKYILMNQ